MTTRASKLLGATVVDPNGRQLGRIADLLIDQASLASVCYALVALEPQAGAAGPHVVAVPWSLLRSGGEERRMVLDASGETLRRMRSLEQHAAPSSGRK
jgi:sporulation protein YlmC with PRC-barrel domain